MGRGAICGEEYNVDKRQMRRISVGEGVLKLWGRKSRFYKWWWGKNIKLYGTIYTSAFKFEKITHEVSLKALDNLRNVKLRPPDGICLEIKGA